MQYNFSMQQFFLFNMFQITKNVFLHLGLYKM